MKWKDVSFTIVDAVDPNSGKKFLEILENSGYRLPKNQTDIGSTSQTVSKIKSVGALGIPRIHQIDHQGNVVETWRLHGAWVKDVEFGELDYDAEELMSIDVTLAYDFAECEFKASGTKLPGANA
jgi:hypothetical protein